ncbi:hypothetical protein V492_06230 [Pseudogymnoascus sp. VKM F-4246]|nr:hypothetical protein V492_06230 [Pseudogymnoascus sp. VKM F-4246]
MSDPPYETTEEDIFISPLTPLLNHIAFVEEGAPIERWCELRRVYYARCTHLITFRRCNNPDNPNRASNNCEGNCRLPHDEYAIYAEHLCPACEDLGHPNPQPSEADYFRLNNEWSTRAQVSWRRFFQILGNAQQDGNLTLQDLDDPEELLRDPNILGQEILAELAACAVEDLREVMSETDSEDGDPEEEDENEEDEGEGGEDGQDGQAGDLEMMEFEIEEPRPDQSEGWVERLPQVNSTLTRAQWYARKAWRTAVQCELGSPPGPYYVPNSADDETGLLIRPELPVAAGETCAVCMIEFTAEDDDDIRRLPCQHLFHFECILRWLHYRNCPVCRNPYSLRRLPRFADDEGGVSSAELPPTPDARNQGGNLQGGNQQGDNPPRAGQQGGGGSQGVQQQGAGLPIRTARNRVKLSYPYNTGSRNSPPGPESGPSWQPPML